jgi:serine/threonine-protein kinase RsbW
VTGLAKRASLAVGLDETASAKVSIAVDEAVTNIILHAYRGAPDKLVEIELLFRPGSLEVHMWHTGQGLRDDQVSLPDPNEYVRRPRKGGLGLLLMSRFMDEVHFFEDGGRNECCMIKRVV